MFSRPSPASETPRTPLRGPIRAFPCWLTLLVTLLVTGGQQEAPRGFNVRDYGALGDGRANDTAAIQDAIRACGAAGGGRVLFPEGRYCSGTFRLRDGVELHLAAQARLIGLEDPAAYAGFESPEWRDRRWNRALIVGEGLRDIAVTGEGVIDGNRVFDPRGEERMRGPHTIMLMDCRNVVLRDLTIRDSGNYAFLFYACEGVRVEDAVFEGGWDGVHFRGGGTEDARTWNRDVRITGCRFATGDDCIAGHYLEDGVVERCRINSSCNGVRLIGPARRLTFAQCEFVGPGEFEHRTSRDQHRTNMLAALLLQPSSWGSTPGPLEDVTVRDVTIRNVACALHVSIRPGNTGGRLTFERLKATGVYGAAVSIEGWADQPLGPVTLRDIEVAYTPAAFADPRIAGRPEVPSTIAQPGTGVFARILPVWGFYGRNIAELHLDRVKFTTDDPGEAHPVVRADEVGRLRLEHLQHSPLPAGTRPVQLNSVGAFEAGLAITNLGPLHPGLSEDDDHDGSPKKWAAVAEKLGADARRVVVRQLGADLGGNTSVRNSAPLTWKEAGYFQRARDLGQVFTAPHDFTLDALVLRTGNSHLAFLPGAAGAEVFVQFFEVRGTPLINDNGTPPGTDATHGFSTNHRCDDFVTGVDYRPLRLLRGGRMPDLLATGDGRLTYLRWDLGGLDELRFEHGQRYAFMVGFVEPGPERNFTLANRNHASSSRPPAIADSDDSYAGGWALRREGNGHTPPLMIPGRQPPTDAGQLRQLQAEARFPGGDARYAIPPTCDGYPDVDTYRDLEFYLLQVDRTRLP